MIHKTNSWSCVVDSFAYVVGIEPKSFFDYIGHDGTDVGFHTQEVIDAMLGFGYSVTEIQRYPVKLHPETRSNSLIGSEKRFIKHLIKRYGVLLGEEFGKPHAVAWVRKQIVNPSTGRRSELLKAPSEESLAPDYCQNSFTPEKLLAVSRIL